MSKKESRPSGDALEQQMVMEMGSFGEATYSDSKCTTKPRKISRLLNRGQRYAIGLKELKAMTGLDERTVRLMIQRERFSGIPILADCKSGYYLPETEFEKELCVRSMLHRSSEIRKAAEAIRRAEVNGE